MTIRYVKLSDEQRSNLAKLADFLDQLPADYSHFDMADYSSLTRPLDWDDMAKRSHCGAVACAVGHGPVAGIPLIPSEYVFDGARLRIYWNAYARRVFGPGLGFCFGGYWSDYDKSPGGAAARIRFVLAHGGTPAGYDDEEELLALYAPFRKEPTDA